ncbi:MAG: O-antigen ligase family protein [Pirellulales bacterium]
MQRAHWVFIALTVATLIPASESAGLRGTHALLALAWFVFAALEFGALARRRAPVVLARVDLVALLLLGWVAASTWLRASTADARTSLNVFWQFGSWVAAYFIARQRFREPTACRALVLALVLACLGQAAAGAYQHQVLQPLAWREYQTQPEVILASQGIPTAPGNIHRAAFESRLQANQPTGTFLHPNSLAGLLAVGIMFAASLCIGSKSIRQRVVWALALVSLSAVLTLTGGRAAAVSAVLGVIAVAWLEWPALRSRPWWTATALVTVVVVIGAWLTWSARAASAVKSLVMRTEYWGATLKIIGRQPWFGCGLGNFQDYYCEVRPAEASEVVADPHNVWLELAATSGLPALGLWFIFLMLHLRRSQHALLSADASPLVEIEPTGRARFSFFNLYTAALGGLFIGLLSAALRLRAPDVRLIGVGVLAAAVFSLLTYGRPAAGEAWKKAIWVAPWVLLVHLQASGGMLYPGLALLLWILLAAGCNLSESRTPPIVAREHPRRSSLGIASMAALAAVVAHFTMFRPLHLADTRMAQAELAHEAGDGPAAMRLAAEASRADPWSGAIARRWLELAWRSPTASDREAAEQAARKLNPRSAALHGWLGNMYLLDYRRSSSRSELDGAIVEYQTVVRLYPNSAVAWAQYAYALHVQGQRFEEMQDAAREALRLDRLQRHDEQKLASQPLFDEPAPTLTALEWVDRLKPRDGD